MGLMLGIFLVPRHLPVATEETRMAPQQVVVAMVKAPVITMVVGAGVLAP